MTARAWYKDPSENLEYIGTGTFSSVEEAKSAAIAFDAEKTGDYHNQYWKQFSPTTWGLMHGSNDTHITVSKID